MSTWRRGRTLRFRWVPAEECIYRCLSSFREPSRWSGIGGMFRRRALTASPKRWFFSSLEPVLDARSSAQRRLAPPCSRMRGYT